VGKLYDLRLETGGPRAKAFKIITENFGHSYLSTKRSIIENREKRQVLVEG